MRCQMSAAYLTLGLIKLQKGDRVHFSSGKHLHINLIIVIS